MAKKKRRKMKEITIASMVTGAFAATAATMSQISGSLGVDPIMGAIGIAVSMTLLTFVGLFKWVNKSLKKLF